ncbi:VOC family protein [Kordiimonas sp.]|uniref:VOC family protein n=1 Tax=Kordiimonas sp. TaxID=1970157 RepID=UPI003A924233
MTNTWGKLRALMAACFLCAGGSVVVKAQEGCDGAITLDHVVYAVPDLAAYALRFEALTGVKPVYGGEHSNGVTANYLAQLGPCTYLEIAGPKEGVTPDMMGERAATYAHAHIAGFALGMRSADEAPALMQAQGLELGEVREGGRQKPDGTSLSWRTVSLSGLNWGENTFQFAIEWMTEPHPAMTSPAGAGIDTLVLSGPSADALEGLVEAYGLPLELDSAAAPQLMLILNTPNGRVELR